MPPIHAEYQPLLDHELPRVHNIQIGGRADFPGIHEVYGPRSGVVQKMLLQPGHFAREFSGTIILSLLEWHEHESTERCRKEIICVWHAQFLPNDPAIRDAIDLTPENKAALSDELKRTLNMLHQVPLVRGCAFVMRFGHRGSTIAPKIDVVPIFRFGERVIMERAQREVDVYERRWWNPFVAIFRLAHLIIYGITFGVPFFQIQCPKVPKPALDLPDLWRNHEHIGITVARLEKALGSLVRRLELVLAQRMIDEGVQPAPGDSETVVVIGSAARAKIAQRRLRRTAGVTEYHGDIDSSTPLPPPPADVVQVVVPMDHRPDERLVAQPLSLGRANEGTPNLRDRYKRPATGSATPSNGKARTEGGTTTYIEGDKDE